MPVEAWTLYGKMQKRAGAFYKQTGRNGMQVENVVKIIQRMLEKDHSKEYVLLGRDAVMIEIIAKLLPLRLRDWLVSW